MVLPYVAYDLWLLYIFMFQSLKLLSVLAAIRLDEDADKIGNTLILALVEHKKDKSTSFQDPLASSTWEEVLLLLIF